MKLELDNNLFHIRFTDLINFLYSSLKTLFSVGIVFAVIGYLYSQYIFKPTYSGSFIFAPPKSHKIVLNENLFQINYEYILEPKYIQQQIESRNYFVNQIELNSFYDGHSKIKVSGQADVSIALKEDLEKQIIAISSLIDKQNNFDLAELNEHLDLLNNEINLIKNQIAQFQQLDSNIIREDETLLNLFFETERNLIQKESQLNRLTRLFNSNKSEIELSQKVILTATESKPILSIFFGFLIGLFIASIFLILQKIFKEIKVD